MYQKKPIRKSGNETHLFNQTPKDLKIIYRDIGGYDMSYEELVRICRESCEGENFYLCNDRMKNRD